MTYRVKGVDGEAPARRTPTTAPSPHRVSVDVAACADVGCGGTMCTEGWCECARAVVPWRAGSAPLKRATLRQCQAQRCGGDRVRRPSRRQPLSVQTGKSGRVLEHRGIPTGRPSAWAVPLRLLRGCEARSEPLLRRERCHHRNVRACGAPRLDPVDTAWCTLTPNVHEAACTIRVVECSQGPFECSVYSSYSN